MDRNFKTEGIYTKTIWDNIQDGTDFLDENEVIEFLNTYPFRTFGEGIAYIICKKDSNAIITDGKKLGKYILQKCTENNVDASLIASRNTFENWYEHSGPKKSKQTRESLFVLSFALCLNIEEVRYLFHKVYMDRFIDNRNYREAVYRYCIENNYDYERATKIIETIQNEEKELADETMPTIYLNHRIETFETDDEIVEFICENWNDFRTNNTAALYNYNELFSEAQKLAKKEYDRFYSDSRDEKILSDRLKFGTTEEKNTAKQKKGRGPTQTSGSFIYKIITDTPISSKGATKKFNNVLKKDSLIRKEVKKNFPKITVINKLVTNHKNQKFCDNYDELRKAIILLRFYTFYGNIETDYLLHDIFDYDKEDVPNEILREQFRASMDDILIECGMPPLYVANPYDLFFILCTYYETPLSVWRDIISEIIENDDSF